MERHALGAELGDGEEGGDYGAAVGVVDEDFPGGGAREGLRGAGRGVRVGGFGGVHVGGGGEREHAGDGSELGGFQGGCCPFHAANRDGHGDST